MVNNIVKRSKARIERGALQQREGGTMRQAVVGLIGAALLYPTLARGVVVDGVAEAQYGSAVVTQQIATAFGNNTLGQLGAANGSELDAAYGFISNSVLYLVIAGNLENNFNKLELFFQTGPGGQNTLTNTNPNVDFNGLNRMGTGGNTAAPGNPGLTFDSDFAPNYWMGVTVGGAGPALHANYARLRSGSDPGVGYYLGSVVPTNSVLSGGSNPFGIRVTINNSNTAGVIADASGCYSNGAPFAPETVVTGVELAIPVSAINATGDVKVCVFVNGMNHDFVSNQILGPLGTNDPGYCQGNLGEPSAVNFQTLPGRQYFIIPAGVCNFAINPLEALFAAVGGSDSVAVTADTGCAWTAASHVPWISITSGSSGTGSGTVTYSVATNATQIGRTGTMTIAGITFTVHQYGQPLPIPINGTAEDDYGCPLVIQAIGTGFGDSSTGQVTVANGNELDGAYGRIVNGVLYLTFAGNLASDFTKLEVFVETRPGGQNTLTNVNPNVDFDGLNRMGTNGNGATNNTPGLTFDADFAPNYWIGVALGGAPTALFANYAELYPGTNGYFLGSTIGDTNGTLFGGTNPFGIQAAVNNLNVYGVSNSTCYDDPSVFQQGSVRTGVELGIPLEAIGSPTGAVKVCVFINGMNHDYVSNQALGPIWDGDEFFCQANLGEPSLVNFAALPGQQHFTVGPEPRITHISRSGNDVNVSWQTQANPSLQYELQRSASLTSPLWVAVGSPTNGTGGVITRTDIGAGAAGQQFYRLKETALPCGSLALTSAAAGFETIAPNKQEAGKWNAKRNAKRPKNQNSSPAAPPSR